MNKVKLEPINRILVIISFTLLIIPSCDARNNYSVFLFYYLPIVAFVIMFVLEVVKILFIDKRLIFFKRPRYLMSHITLTMLILLFLLYSFIMVIAHDIEINDFFRFVYLFFFYFILVQGRMYTVSTLSIAICFANVYIAYRSLFELQIKMNYYEGTTINSNQFALVLFAGILLNLYLFIRTKRIFYKLILVLIEAIFLILLYFSSSRTVMLVTVFNIYIIFLYCLHRNGFYFLKGRMNKKYFYGIIFFMTLFIIFLFKYWIYIYKFLFAKWGTHSVHLLSGRTEIWKTVFVNMGVFKGMRINVNTNSEYLNWINNYGLFSFIIFALIVVSVICLSFKNYRHDKSIDNFFILCIILSYLIICIFENIFAIYGKPINILFFWSLGYSFRYSLQHIKMLERGKKIELYI